MPKRKRSETDVDETIDNFTTQLFRKLKFVKGIERQRQAKRIRLHPERADRVEKEIVVLKSLDLHQAAQALLCNALLKVKDVADSPRLPEEIKKGVPKPNVSEEERILLHNVTSNLYHHPQVREVLDQAIAAVCKAVRVPVPEKTKVKKMSDRGKETNDQKKASQSGPKPEPDERSRKREPQAGSEEQQEHGRKPSDTQAVTAQPDSDSDDERQERAVARLEEMLGSSSGSDGSDAEGESREGADHEDAQEFDPMEITDDEDDEEDEFEGFSADDFLEQEDDSGDYDTAQEDISSDDSPDEEAPTNPPPSKNAATVPKKATKVIKASDSTFLPTLMSGYVSGSESASDVDGDIAPARKNRRGQRARQAIWEKRYKEQAKHLHQQKQGKNAGWDPKRGAVGKDDPSKPWKQGVRNPLERQGRQNRNQDTQIQHKQVEAKPPPKERKRDDQGPIHPSWEAAKKAKEKALTAPFQGKKITFD